MSKNNIIEIQSIDFSKIDIKNLYSFDREVIDSPTKPLFHQTPRFIYIVKGKGKINIQNKLYDIGKGSLVTLLPWEYSVVEEVNEPIRFYIIKYNFEIVSKIFHMVYPKDYNKTSIVDTIFNNAVVNFKDDKMLCIFESLKESIGEQYILYNKNQDYLSTLFIINKIIEIFIVFLNLSKTQKVSESNKEINKVDIFRYMYFHLSENLTLSSVANMFFISESTVNRYIKQVLGLSFNQLLSEMRIGRTIDLLLYTDLSVEEISLALGYANESHLSKIIKDRIGNNPLKYRKLNSTIQSLCKIHEMELSYKILSYIIHNYSENITLENIANKYKISKVRVNILLTRITERNLSDLLDYVRIIKASQLLLETDKSLTDIAYNVGFNSYKTFYRKFLKIQKIQPHLFKENTDIEEKI